MRTYVLAAAAMLTTVSIGTGRAQSPSADDIIAGLRPSAQQLQGPTRGIRRLPVMQPPAATEPAARRPRAQSAAVQPRPDDGASGPSVKLVVDFRSGSADLAPPATSTLDQLGRALASTTLSAYRFRIEGHTDTVGDPDTNRDLSQRRAQVVASYLQDKFGIAQARLDVVGKGSSDLLVATPDQTPEPRNRRVRIVNLGS